MKKTPVQYVYLTFGDSLYYHSQLIYSILSVIANSPDDREFSFTIVTDKPEYYAWLGRSFVIISVTEDMLQKWRGDYDFFWRIKIKSVLEALNGSKSHFVYFDTDTIVSERLEGFLDCLDKGNNLMHIKEFDFHNPKGRTTQKMKKHGLEKIYGKFKFSCDKSMWNAGVVAISFKNMPEETLNDALDACDAMCSDGMERRLIEQFSFSLALQSTSICAANSWVRHYWGNKPQWNDLIARFFTEVQLKQMSVEGAVELFKVQQHDLQDYFKESKLDKFKNSIQKRLKKLTK